MKALDLIDSIFARPQGYVSRDVRRITGEQLAYLRDLIEKDPEAAKVRSGQNGSLVWMPAGCGQFVLTEDTSGGKKHTLARLGGVETEKTGSLF